MSPVLAPVLAVVVALVVPLGVRLLDVRPRVPAWCWLGAGLPAAAATLMTPGIAAVVLALPWCLLCGLTTASGALRLAELRAFPARTVAALSASTSLGVAALALVVDRVGAAPLLGFDAETWRLTALHFSVAGFAASLLAGLCLLAHPTRAAAASCWAVPIGTATVAAGHFAGGAVEVVGALVLTAGLLTTSAVTVRHLPDRKRDGAQLLVAAAAVTPASMALALWWSVGHATGLPHLTISQTAATHGIANALGVGLCGVLGWTALAKEQL